MKHFSITLAAVVFLASFAFCISAEAQVQRMICDGQIDPVVWYESGVWKGADSLRAEPFWMMARVGDWGGWFVAICKKTRSDLGWKSIGFVIPAGGMQPGKGICYDLFPRLPSYVQEIIEEMTATELLCPFTEFDPGLNEWPDRPDREIDYDWEADYRER